MDITEAMRARHSVRTYLDQPIEKEKADKLQAAIEAINSKSGLHIQLILEEPEAFGGKIAHYGRFRGCKNYFALVSQKGREEDLGYYGEQLVLLSQQLGLNTCWAALTYSKSKVPAICNEGEKVQIVIALGYGQTQGVPHKSKPMEKLCKVDGGMPEWFQKGMEAAMMAPTAINQQKFLFTLEGDKVKAKALFGPNSKMDLGIVKYHFEIGAGVKHYG